MPRPKLTSAQMKAAIEEFKSQFTPGFYHGSPSNRIKAFDPKHPASESGTSADASGDKFSNAVFLTKDPSFANSFLPTGSAMGYRPESTIYPVSANLGKHFDHETPEGKAAIKHFLSYQYPINPEATKAQLKTVIADRANALEDLNRGSWTAVESPEFQDFLRQNNYDSFSTVEAGRKNVGIFEPHNIRGKFAEYNPEEAMNPDFMKAQGGLVHLAGGGVPKDVVKAYKLFRTKPSEPGTLYPLFVNANKPVPVGEWVQAEVGPVAASGKVKSKLGELAYRPGWHAGDLPIATHIGGKSDPKLKAPDFRRPEEVWAEVEMPNDVDWQTIANQRAELNKAGQPIARTAHITDEVPFGGHYRYKTSPNMQGNWLIGGDMKVNRILTDEEVQAINEAAGAADLPRFTPLPGKADGGLVSLNDNSLPNLNVTANSMPNMTGMPGVGYMQMPQGAMLRAQLEQELKNKARLRAGATGMGMALPGQHGVKMMPGSLEAGLNLPVGSGNVDISGYRSINPVNMPAQQGGHLYGANIRYTLPFKKGGKV